MYASTQHGPPHPFKKARIVTGTVTGILLAVVKCLFAVNRSFIQKGF
jgi:hypothetical protein